MLLTLPVISTLSFAAPNDAGLGPLTSRNQFPVGLQFLQMTPSHPLTLPAEKTRFSYQFGITNTFINTQFVGGSTLLNIDFNTVEAGLDASDFPPQSYGYYLDVESHRHLLRWEYGLVDGLEGGVELGLASFGGGFLDSRIEAFERYIGFFNETRKQARQDRFHYYIFFNGNPLVATEQPFDLALLDPIFNLKWNWSQGGDLLPVISVKFSYKHPLSKNPRGAKALVNSGGGDHGIYWLLSKGVGSFLVAHIQAGRTFLSVKPNTYARRLEHRTFGVEFRINSQTSFLLQSISQSSVFLRDFPNLDARYPYSLPSDVILAGFKGNARGWFWEIGTLEDYRQNRNEADITFFGEIGKEW